MRQNFAVNQTLRYIDDQPEENIPRLMELVDRYTPGMESKEMLFAQLLKKRTIGMI